MLSRYSSVSHLCHFGLKKRFSGRSVAVFLLRDVRMVTRVAVWCEQFIPSGFTI